jgi:hypothetical protein
MTTSDWIIDIALILIVFRQLRESRLSAFTILLPLAIMGWAVSNYLHGVPTAGHDMILISALTAVGALCGILSGLFTRVRSHDGKVYVKATLGAAAVWVVSMGARMAFAVWTSHPSGQAHIASFSASNDITSGEAWVVALLGMAFAEVIVRMAIIFTKGQLASRQSLATAS